MAIIEAYGLTKFYNSGRVKALDDVSLNIERGQIFSLLGPNGAGKTTLVKLLLGIAIPTRGTGKLNQIDIRSPKSHTAIGYLPENHRFPDFLTAHQILYYFGKMNGLPREILYKRIPELLHVVGLSEWGKTRIRKFSKGMLQRLGMAQALIHEPAILFLDEPTDGIDPIGRREIRDLLLDLKRQGKTIFLNSHLLSEVERVSDEIAILKKGKLLQKGRVEDFISMKQQYQIQITGPISHFEQLCRDEHILLSKNEKAHIIKVENSAQLNVLIDKIRAKNLQIEAVIPHKISLEDFFIDVLDMREEEG